MQIDRTGQLEELTVGGRQTEEATAQTGRRKQEDLIMYKALLIIHTVEIQYMFSKAPTSQISLLGDLLSNAVQTSKQWEIEKRQGETTTECLTTLIPKGENEDISITLWVGRREGLQVLELFKLRRTWSALPKHLSLQPQTRREQNESHLV